MMIKEIKIENYKSIHKLKLQLGRITVLIGENGSGKTNILEAIALAGAANNNLDNEFLASRGIRVTEPQYMRAAFEPENLSQDIKISIEGEEGLGFSWAIAHDNRPDSQWFVRSAKPREYVPDGCNDYVNNCRGYDTPAPGIAIAEVRRDSANLTGLNIGEFKIYTPQSHCLRSLEIQGHIQPLGINGEGLLKLVSLVNKDREQQELLKGLQEKMRLIDWVKGFEILPDMLNNINKINVRDKYLQPNLTYGDPNIYNEGFLLLLFYLTLFLSKDTPTFFAIDNIDTSLNPKLCSRLIQELVELAKKHDKQAIITAHNPGVLDGLNLDDREQRLLVIYRNMLGHTKARRILKPEPLEGQEPVKLSEAFLRGYIGGLPKGF